jgi:hypothetical protein
MRGWESPAARDFSANEALAIARFPRMALYRWLIREPHPGAAVRPSS